MPRKMSPVFFQTILSLRRSMTAGWCLCFERMWRLFLSTPWKEAWWDGWYLLLWLPQPPRSAGIRN